MSDRSDTVLILNSANATTVDLTTGSASFVLSEQLSFTDRLPKIAVNSFSFTNWFLNISAALGNNKIYYSDDTLDKTKYTITVPDGSYTPETLNTFIVNELADQAVAPGLFQILPDYSQNKIYIQYAATTGWFVRMHTDSPYTVLGLTVSTSYPASESNTASEVVYADTTAAFNNIETINVKTNLSNNFIYGTNQSSVLFSTGLTAQVGYVQQTAPYNLLWSDSRTLQSGISEIVISITDQNDAAVNMSENFIVTLQIRY